jgi:acyl-CoA synthetase (NDP forming)
MAQDDETKVIAVYLEGCRNGKRLEQALSMAYEAGKPVVIQKVGCSEVGTAAAALHTASVTGSDQVYDAVFDRYNVFRCRTVDELIDIVYACSAGVYPTHGKVCIVTISGGAGVMMADAASAAGLDVAPLSEKSQRKLKALTPFAAVRNPVDFTAQVYNDMSLITKNYETILGDESYDAIVGFFMFLPYSDYLCGEILKALKPVRDRFPDRLIVQSIFGPKRNIARFEDEGYLVIAEPCRALEVVAALVKIGQGFARGLPRVDDLSAPTLQHGVYNEIEAKQVLAEAGIPVEQKRLVEGGVETILGVQNDPVFGPVVRFGLGGALTDVLGVTFRRAPFGEDEARQMIETVEGFPLLAGASGTEPADVVALAKTIARLSVFAEVNREVIESIEVNPLLAQPAGQGVVALDALIVTKSKNHK